MTIKKSKGESWQVAFGRQPKERLEAIYNGIKRQTEDIFKTLPRGKSDYPGFETVRSRLQAGAEAMALLETYYGSEDHSRTMAIMGCGDEETQKAHVFWLRTYGWIK